jgi:hypothetical protein
MAPSDPLELTGAATFFPLLGCFRSRSAPSPPLQLCSRASPFPVCPQEGRDWRTLDLREGTGAASLHHPWM